MGGLAGGFVGGDGRFGEVGGRWGEFEPRAATGKGWGVGEAPDGGESEGLDLGEVEKFFVTRIEVFANGFRVVGGEGEEFLNSSRSPNRRTSTRTEI